MFFSFVRAGIASRQAVTLRAALESELKGVTFPATIVCGLDVIHKGAGGEIIRICFPFFVFSLSQHFVYKCYFSTIEHVF